MRKASSRRRISTSFAVWSATLCPRSPPSRRPVRFVHRPDHAANDTCRRNPPSSVATFARVADLLGFRSEEHTSELQSLMRISYAVFCLKNKIQYSYLE